MTTQTQSPCYQEPGPGEFAGCLTGSDRDALQHSQWMEGWYRTLAWTSGDTDTVPVGDHEPAATKLGRDDFLKGPYIPV